MQLISQSKFLLNEHFFLRYLNQYKRMVMSDNGKVQPSGM